MYLSTIDVELNEFQHEGEPTPQPYLKLIVDGEPLPTVFDAIEFATCDVKKANLFLVTCTCGVAGCAGRFFGYEVKKRRNTVEWRNGDADDVSPKERRFHAFDRSQYEAVQKKTIAFLYEIAQGYETGRWVGDEDDYTLNIHSVTKLEAAIKRHLEWKNHFGWT